jgi:PPM family protein phosphatase
MPTLECPSCQTAVLTDDRFCEVCGTPLNPTSHPTTAANSPPVATSGCPKCGAPASAIDPDGYCDQCGFRHQAVRASQESDHIVLSLNPQFAAVSDRGIHHHQNEDFFAIDELNASQILVVCDGVSSSIAPQTASQAAAKAACQALITGLGQGAIDAPAIQAAIDQAQIATAGLTDAASDDPPSTTIIAAVVQNGIATIGWLGDSRAYWIGQSGGHQLLTQDHSWFNEQVDSGQLTAAEAHRDPKAHAITRWLGADADAEPASTRNFPFPGAGYFILCSDGLWNYLSDADHLAALIAGSSDAPTIAQKLVDYANAKGGRDNITIAVLIT